MILSLEKTDDVNNGSLKKLEKLVSKENTMLLNHATWCGHCHAFASEWEKLTSEGGKGVNFVKIENQALQKIKKENTKLYKRLTPKNGMIYFPMIVVFAIKQSDKPSSKKIYEGARTADSLQTYIQKTMSAKSVAVAKTALTKTPSAKTALTKTASTKTPSAKTPSAKTASTKTPSAKTPTSVGKTKKGGDVKSIQELNKQLDDLINLIK